MLDYQAIGTLFVAGLFTLQAGSAERLPERWNVRDHIPLDDFVIQSHRGAGVLSSENSIAAFEIAWGLGTIPEADLRTTRDGVIVAFHDSTFARTLPGAPPELRAKGIADLRWDEVRALDIGAAKGAAFTGQHVARMSDVYEILHRYPKRRLYVDIKNIDLKQLAAEAGGAGVADRLILASTDYAVIQEWKRLAPASKTLLWMGGAEAELGKRLRDLEKNGFRAVDQLQIHVRAQGPQGISPSPEFLAAAGEQLRAHGILFQTLPWDVTDPAFFARLMDLGVASFATDYPDVAMAAVKSYYQSKAR